MGRTRKARSRAGLAARLLARCAVVAATAAVVVLLLALGGGGLLVVMAGILGLVVCAAGIWWLVARRGLVRLLGAFLAVAAPAGVLVFYARSGLWLTALISSLCWATAVTCGRTALHRARPPRSQRPVRARPPRRAVLIMNPKSGGGKVARFDLVKRAERLGARVILLDPSAPVDVGGLAREAVEDGADLLGVAGGDGTQALVAAVAAEHGLPFLVISAGTRNHFAMDLGLDRADPARCLDALTDGEEIRVDLGDVSGRPFVNTVSFGVYADIVQSPEYRDDKTGTALKLMPDLLAREGARRIDAWADGTRLADQQALLISNNPYVSPDELSGGGRRAVLDDGELGVIGISVANAAQAAQLALWGSQAPGLTVTTARRVEVTAGGPQSPETGGGEEAQIPVAVDGEALWLRTPVVCSVRPRALRVLLPRDRPGAPPPAPPVDWRKLLALAWGPVERTASGESRT
ncbi:diacylglycerol/lipid kinase family protein [Streptomyces rochei]|uniref:diacylglycerol/lipid kinase family protein n=1 Tax=Streptomyces TaxID=1883 RepID=UPI00109E3A3B|nr:diacylglycerol kinase family protein [Streptomyces sp. SS52]QCB27192.1 diacylglycerol kinase [Streptomyces sp. SS52]